LYCATIQQACFFGAIFGRTPITALTSILVTATGMSEGGLTKTLGGPQLYWQQKDW
jgi:hypothetical protein